MTHTPMTERPPDPEGTWDVYDVAILLKLSPRQIWRMVDRKEIPGVIRLGKNVRFHKRIVSEWLDSKAQGGSVA